MSFSGDFHVLDADELSFERWFTVLQEHFDYFSKILVQFIEGFALGMSPRKSRDVANIEPRIRTSFDNCRV